MAKKGKRTAAASRAIAKVPEESAIRGEGLPVLAGPSERIKTEWFIPTEISPQNIQIVPAPQFYASGVNVQATGTEYVFTFTRMLPAIDQSGKNPGIGLGTNAPVAILSMSPQAVKDMIVVIQPMLAKQEKDFGEIHTPFTQARSQEIARKKRAH